MIVIAGTLRKRINQVAHRMASAHEASARRELTEKIRKAADKGADIDALLTILDDIEEKL